MSRDAEARPLNVMYVIWSLGLGGAEQVMIRLATGLDRRRFTPVIVCLNGPGPFAHLATQSGINVIALHKQGPFDLRVLVRLVRFMRQHQIDVVHTQLWGANVWGRLAARLAGVPMVIATEQNVDTWKRWHHFFIDRVLAQWTTELIAVSQKVREFYEAHHVGNGRWRVIYNAVDIASTKPRGRGAVYAQLGIQAQEPVVGLIGRLVPAKAPQDFVEAIAQAAHTIPSLKAVVIGDGPLRENVQEQVKRCGLERRVVFTGMREDVPDLLAGMDILVFTSEREGSSLAMLEAMAAGVPVIATRVGGTPELIESGINGLLVSPHSPQEVAGHIVDLLMHSAKAETIQRAARRRVEQCFSLSQMIEAHEALYESRAQASPPGPTPTTVMLLIDHLNVGGAQRQLVGLARTLPAARWRVVVVSLSVTQTAFLDELRQASITVHTIAQHGAVDFRCLWEVMRLMRRYRPDIVHTWLFTADTYGRLAAWLTGRRRLIAAMRNPIDDLPRHHRLANRWLTNMTAAVTINADAIRPGMVREGGVAEQKIRTIYNGLDLRAYPAAHPNGALREAWHVPPGGRVIAMIARLAPQKDHRTFLEAVEHVSAEEPSTVFLIVGDGALREEITREVAMGHLVQQVQLLGERRDVWALLHQIDVCVLSTHYEGCSNVIMEAMAAAKPVIATDVGGNRELVVDGETGLLVRHKDPVQLAEAMLALLRDPAKAEAMGRRGRARIEAHFSLEATVRQTAALYEELLKS